MCTPKCHYSVKLHQLHVILHKLKHNSRSSIMLIPCTLSFIYQPTRCNKMLLHCLILYMSQPRNAALWSGPLAPLYAFQFIQIEQSGALATENLIAQKNWNTNSISYNYSLSNRAKMFSFVWTIYNHKFGARTTYG